MAKIYPDNFEFKTGFDKIRGFLKGYCLGSLGQDKVDEIVFFSDADRIRDELSVSEEFSRLI
ncbi:MAG: hypothetical protein PHI28_00005, partial [Mangrovibacterium sp.]|nr:hypothetical protein [Mangrovibacterium sp.]